MVKLTNNLLFFAWWVNLQQVVEAWPRSRRLFLLGVSLGLGIGARLWAQNLPGNWDFGQWINVSTAVLSGQDPYETYGYNYPAPWLLTLTLFQLVTSTDSSFRLLISLLLIVADIGIVLILMARGYLLAGCLFILSPITIAISGQHQQIEGIAVALALAAVLLFSRTSGKRVTGMDWSGALLLGLSLSFKPVFLLLPLWLVLRPGPWKVRLVRGVVPGIGFAIALALSFIPYPASSVLPKVLGHGGANNSPFINEFVPQQLAPWVLENQGGKGAFVIMLVVAGWFLRRLPVFELALVYSITALVFSWAAVNQYLATPMAGIAVYLNAGFLIWLFLSAMYLSGDPSVLNLPVLNQIHPHVFLEWSQVMQDLFPWLLIGWLILMFAHFRRQPLMSPRRSVVDD